MNQRTQTQLMCGILSVVLLAVTASPALAVVISGRVPLEDGTPAAAILMKVTGLPDNTLTNNQGYYSVTVPAGFTGTVTPTDVNFVFEPESREYALLFVDQTNQNYEALQAVFSVFGFVRDADGVGIADVELSGFPLDISTDADGYYQTYVLRDWSGTVTPSKSGYTSRP
jgi:hypothetical protein